MENFSQFERRIYSQMGNPEHVIRLTPGSQVYTGGGNLTANLTDETDLHAVHVSGISWDKPRYWNCWIPRYGLSIEPESEDQIAQARGGGGTLYLDAYSGKPTVAYARRASYVHYKNHFKNALTDIAIVLDERHVENMGALQQTDLWTNMGITSFGFFWISQKVLPHPFYQPLVLARERQVVTAEYASQHVDF